MKEAICGFVLGSGADVCGFAEISRFDKAPRGFHPADIFPECRTVIVFGLALPAGLYDVPPRLIYGHFNDMSCPRVDEIALMTAREIERLSDGRAVPLPADSPYESWDQGAMEGRGLISMQHAAVLAGLGILGKSTLLLNKRYGNRLTLGAVLMDCALPGDPLAECLCPDGCRLCLDSCPVGAIGPEGVTQRLCRAHTYGRNARGHATVDCNQCRAVCPMRHGKG